MRHDYRMSLRNQMKRPGQSPALVLAFAIFLTGVLSGCTTFGKCGLGGCPGDADITAQVDKLLAQHPALQPPNLIQVQTLDRVVYLSGLVDTDFQQQMAQSVALQVPGVSRVVNSIGLSGGR
jgi:osmotically-inducible protein OsmY